jgi:hypothetical protein
MMTESVLLNGALVGHGGPLARRNVGIRRRRRHFANAMLAESGGSSNARKLGNPWPISTQACLWSDNCAKPPGRAQGRAIPGAPSTRGFDGWRREDESDVSETPLVARQAADDRRWREVDAAL